MSVTRLVIVGSIWSTVTRILNIFFRIAVVIILARLLTPEDFGLYQVLSVLFLYVLAFSNSGLGSAIVQLKDIHKDHLDTTFWSYIILGTFGTICFYVFAPLASLFFHQKELTIALRAISPAPLIYALSSLNRNLLLKELKIKELSLIDTMSYLVGFIPVTLLMAFYHFGYWSLIAGFMVQSILMTILSIRAYSYRPRWQFSTLKFKELFRYGFLDMVNNIAGMSSNNADTFFIGRVMGPVQLGFYSRAYNLMAFNVSLFSDFIDRVLFAGFSIKQDEDKSLIKAFIRADFLMTAIMVPLSIYCVVSSDSIITLFLGKKWLPASLSFQILSLGLLFRLNYKITFSIIRAKGKMVSAMNLMLINLGLTILLMLFFKRYGIEGIAFALLLSMVYRYLHLLYLVKKFIPSFNVIENFRKNGLVYLLGLIYFTVMFFLRNLELHIHPPFWELAFNALILGIVFLPLFFNAFIKDIIHSLFKLKFK